LNKRPLCFCCTILRDVISVKWYFTSIMSTTCILQHEVVCKVTILFPDFIDGMWWFLVQGSMVTSPVDVPQRHVPCCLQRAYLSTHKGSLAMMLLWIWQWRRLDVSFNVRLRGVGVWRPLVSASAGKPSDSSVFF
jgi:hypothetical protein